MAAAAPWVAALLLFPLIAAGIPSGGSEAPLTVEPSAHLTPPNPTVRTWPAGVVQAAPLPPRPRAETEGTLRVLVLLIEFVDVAHDTLRDGGYFEDTFNNPDAQSLRAYYEEVSFGRLTINSTIVPTWWRSSQTMAFYGNDTAGGVDNANGPIYRLVVEAVRAADPSVDFNAFDANSDRVVDHLVVVHAGLGQEDHNATDLIWSHRWAVPDADPMTPGSQPLEADGVQVYGYIMVSEASPVGVVTHEFGHELGLPDLYDGDESSAGAGRWDLMAGGTWNGFPAGSSPAHLSAWSRAQLGWIVPVTATGILEGVRIEAIETQGLTYLLPIRSGTPAEYFLVENRQPFGFDAALPGSGLLIWHVDEAMTTNDLDGHRLLDLEEADEAGSGDNPVDSEDAWTSTSIGFGPETVPNSDAYNGEATGWRVREISNVGSAIVATIAKEVERDLAISEIARPLHVVAGPNETVSARVIVRNDGRSPENVTLRIRVYNGTLDPMRLRMDRTDTYPELPAQTSVVFNVTFETPWPGRYLIHGVVPLEGDGIPANNERLAHVLANTYIFQDDVEAGPGSWTLDGATDDPHRWRIVNDSEADGASHSRSRAWRFGYVPNPSPNPSPPAWHTLTSPEIALAPCGLAANDSCPLYLAFYHRYDLQGRVEPPPSNLTASDTAVVQARFFSGEWTPWEGFAAFTARDRSWQAASMDLSQPRSELQSTSFQFRFNVSSEVMQDDGGWWVDDIMVIDTAPGLGRELVLLGTPGLLPAEAGGSASFLVKIVNVGELDEVVRLSASLPPSWEARFSTDGHDMTPIDEFSSRLTPDAALSLNVTVFVSGDTAPEVYPGNVTVLSVTESSVRASVPFEIAVREPVRTGFSGFLFLGAAVAVAAGLLTTIAVVLRRRRPRTR